MQGKTWHKQCEHVYPYKPHRRANHSWRTTEAVSIVSTDDLQVYISTDEYASTEDLQVSVQKEVHT